MTKLIELVDRYRQGPYPVFAAGPFLSIASLRAKNLRFARVLTGAEEMAEAALLNLNLGFESTVVPFDMNVEAELIGCRVNYHEEVDGVPVYPTVGDRWIETADDFHLPANLIEIGRMPAITAAMKTIKQKAGRRAALGAFILGPFTLAGQVLDPDRMFVSVLKKPDSIRDVLAKLAELIARVRRVYVDAGADFIAIEEGGATSISPQVFGRLVLPALNRILADRAVPHILSLAGRSERYIPMLEQTGADGIGVDQECDIGQSLRILPPGFPLLATCGAYDMLANATPAEVRSTVRDCLDRGVLLACPPADIYPPARLENIAAFVEAHRTYPRWVPGNNSRSSNS
ncbi:MAG: uroporphyrinogen decarboxylase family protein [Deltaproteobacteria bacterium]|nr:uroporphyrinogen decarboxylase family protein [Deltaproteobacteria bacterium]